MDWFKSTQVTTMNFVREQGNQCSSCQVAQTHILIISLNLIGQRQMSVEWFAT